MQNEGDTLN